MKVAALLDALDLPPNARVGQRVPKKLLLEQGAPTAADRRLIQEGIEELFWVAALKPANCGVPAFRDEVREYLEIAVLTVNLRAAGKPGRLGELIHRAIPYPVVLVASQGGTVNLSLAHKRWSQGEGGKTVLDSDAAAAVFAGEDATAMERDFLTALALAKQPRAEMRVLYQGWIDCVTALAAARITGAFARPASADHAAAWREGLDAHARIQRDLVSLRARAVKEKQINRRVDLNLEIKRLETELAALTINLRSERAL